MTPADSCVHEPGPTDCPTLGCFRALPCPGADEAWGLGKYSLKRVSDGYFGDLIYALKYESLPQHMFDDALSDLSTQVSRFLGFKYEHSFDGCVVVNGNRTRDEPVMLHVAKHLQNHKQIRAHETLQKKGYIPVLKQLNRELRKQAVLGKYELSADSRIPMCKHILVVDDVYDSGATLAEAAATVRAAAPTAHIVALTATYLRDPRED